MHDTKQYPQKTLAEMSLSELLEEFVYEHKRNTHGQIYNLILLVFKRDYNLTEVGIKDKYPEYFL